MLRLWAFVCSLSPWLVGCGEPAHPSRFGPGLSEWIQVKDAGLRDSEFGTDEGGPAVSQVLRPQLTVHRGESGIVVAGRLAPGGVALHLRALGNHKHWVLPAKGFDFVVADELTWQAELALAHDFPGDRLVLQMQAADADGRRGPMATAELQVLPDLPPAELQVSLGWDHSADVDLHLETPSGAVVGVGNLNSFVVPPGQLPPPEAWMQGGWLEYDANQGCRLDHRNREDIVWLHAQPPPGVYRVYADLFSSCGHEVVDLELVVRYQGQAIESAYATLYAFDARIRPAAGEAPGLLLASFEVPAAQP